MATPLWLTFVGIGIDCDPAELSHLAEDYPGQVQFGVLLSPQRTGQDPKYPDIDWILSLEEHGLSLAAYLTGRYGYDILDGKPLPKEVGKLLRNDLIERIQVDCWTDDRNRIATAIGHARQRNLPLTLQCRESFPPFDDVRWVCDPGGGRGMRPAKWPMPPKYVPGPVGFAGGINPHTVASIVKSLHPFCRYWLDLSEGSLRDSNNRFSMVWARKACEAIYGPAVATRNRPTTPVARSGALADLFG